MFNLKINSFNIKVVTSLLILGLLLLTILFALIVPNMQKEQREYTKNQIEHMIALTNQQLKLAVKFLITHTNTKKEEHKTFIKYELNRLQNTIINNHHNPIEITTLINTVAKKINCDIQYDSKHLQNTIQTNPNKQFQNKNIFYNQWTPIQNKTQQSVCPTPISQIMYALEFQNQSRLVIACSPTSFYDTKQPLENKIKKDIQESFNLTQDFHKGKTYLMWVDVSQANTNNQPLFQKNDTLHNPKYCISKMSNINYPRTGMLTAKQLLNAADKEPILHLIDTEKHPNIYNTQALTWVRSINYDKQRRLLFLTTVYLKDFDNKIDSSFWKILPAALFALLLAISVGFFLFRRFFRTISILSNTAREINNGNINIRSHIKGNDDIGILGTAFDSMLDSIEKNITQLDNQVNLKTKELRHSLEEKETLLQEIHHRVKNNLAMTINLIKLQKSKIQDEQTKSILTDIQERIYTMELLHRKLYESKDLNSIPMKKYIEELIEDITTSYSDCKNIRVKTDIEASIFLNIEYAMPCGLIINESITNALKYAFKEQKGTIDVILYKEDNLYTLIIKDDGKGLPSSINIHTTKTLGLRLISTITKGQLLGSIECNTKEGTELTIRFSI